MGDPLTVSPSTRLWEWLQSLPPDQDGWRQLPGSMRQRQREFGFRGDGSASQVLREWTKNGKVEVRKAGSGGPTASVAAVRFTDQVPPAERVVVEREGSAKEALLEMIRQHVTERGFLNLSLGKLRRSLGLNAHDLNKYLFDLKDEQLVSFAVKGSGSNMTPYNVRLRPAGTVVRRKDSNEELPKPQSQPRPQEAPSNGQTVGEDSRLSIERAAHRAVARYAEPMVQRYPLLSDLMRRAKRAAALSRAAGLLEQEGLIEEAVELISREELSPIEQEFVRFLQERHAAESVLLAEHDPELNAETGNVRPAEGVSS